MNRIAGDKCVNDLSDDTSRLAFTWLITFADCEGRTHGDPAMVRSMVFPRREDVSVAQMETYITEWARLGLIIWYEAKGDKWIWFPGFEDNQPGLVKAKEAPSRIPAPPEVQTESSASPAQGQTKASASPSELKESKGKESKDNNASGEKTATRALPSARQEQNTKRADLEQHFAMASGLPVLKCETTKQKRSAGELWWGPLREILELQGWDEYRSKNLIDLALARMRENRLTVSSPKSILNVARAIFAEGAQERVIIEHT